MALERKPYVKHGDDDDNDDDDDDEDDNDDDDDDEVRHFWLKYAPQPCLRSPISPLPP